MENFLLKRLRYVGLFLLQIRTANLARPLAHFCPQKVMPRFINFFKIPWWVEMETMVKCSLCHDYKSRWTRPEEAIWFHCFLFIWLFRRRGQKKTPKCGALHLNWICLTMSGIASGSKTSIRDLWRTRKIAYLKNWKKWILTILAKNSKVTLIHLKYFSRF